MRLSINPGLAYAIGALQVLAVTVTAISYTLLTNDTLIKIAQQNIKAAASRTAEFTESSLTRTRESLAMSASLIGEDVISSSDELALERYFLEHIKKHRLLSGIFVGRPDGSFLLVKRDRGVGDKDYFTKIVRVTNDERTVNIRWRNKDLKEVDGRIDPDDTFDPRNRPWYKKALAEKGVVSTDPYVFFTSQQPGVTLAASLPGGKGVIGIDFEISSFQRFLKKLSRDQKLTIFIYDQNQSVIAHSDQTSIKPGQGGKPRFSRVDEIDSPASSLIAEMSGGQNNLVQQVVEKTHRSETYHVAITSLKTYGLPWSIAIEAREKDYVTGWELTLKIGAALAAVMTLLGLGFGLSVARSVSQPLAALRNNAARVSEGKQGGFEAVRSPFKEIQQVSTTFMGVVQELKALKDGDEGDK